LQTHVPSSYLQDKHATQRYKEKSGTVL